MPDALGLEKIQFCQADKRPNILVGKLSFPGNLKFASKPVRASGEKEALSSTLILISSFQSKSSGITVTKPSEKDFSASNNIFF